MNTLTIGQAAAQLNRSTHTLRYYQLSWEDVRKLEAAVPPEEVAGQRYPDVWMQHANG